jgi:hypothetical protein
MYSKLYQSDFKSDQILQKDKVAIMSPKYKGRGFYFRISAENVDACGQNKAFVKHSFNTLFFNFKL